MESGQPPHFLWSRADAQGNAYSRKIGGKEIVVEQKAGGLRFDKRYASHVNALLRAGDDLGKIAGQINTDAVMARALARFAGMRLTKNGEWETLVSYLCSQNSNIARIRANVQALCRNGSVIAPEEMAQMPSSELAKINLGYREGYLRESAKMVGSGEFDLMGLHKLDYGEAADELQKLPGVGPKVADCVLLYGFGKLSAFPHDVWIGRAMGKWYGVRTQKQVREFASQRWGPLAGYAQQYLFMLARSELGGTKARECPPGEEGKEQTNRHIRESTH